MPYSQMLDKNENARQLQVFKLALLQLYDTQHSDIQHNKIKTRHSA
jgi:hypothetical protein